MPSRITYSKRPKPTLKVNGTTAELYNRYARDKDARRFYNSPEWRAVRELYLNEQPYCEDCLDKNIYTPAVIVHHVEELRDRPDLALDLSNLRAVCRPCHGVAHGGKRVSDTTQSDHAVGAEVHAWGDGVNSSPP